MIFSIAFKGKQYTDISLSLLGRHNVLNAAAVFGLCLQLQLQEETIRKAFASFAGVHRRMQPIGCVHSVDFFDDYGHHPYAIKKTLLALKKAVRERRVVALFQPHRYTRTQDLMKAFSTCLQDADEIFVTDIYAAHEEPIKNVSSEILVEKMRRNGIPNSYYLPKNEAVGKIVQILRPHDVFITVGAGDVTYLGKKIYAAYQNDPNKLQVALLYGGKSSEHDISLLSASYVEKCLDPEIYQVKRFYINPQGQWTKQEKITKEEKLFDEVLPLKIFFDLNSCDLCLPIMHGPYGEDGLVQGFLEALDIAYVGCDYRACVIAMNKAIVKAIALKNGIATAPYVEILADEWKTQKNACLEKLNNMNLPLFIKPVHLGSSIGIQYVEKVNHLQEAVDFALSYDNQVVVEEKMIGREIEFSVLGTDYIRIASPGEILTHGGLYDYEKKYGSNAMKTQVPAEISRQEEEIGQQLAEKIYRLCGCSGMARIDFFLDETGKFWFNEINPIPGFTSISLYPKCFAHSGLEGKKLVSELIVSALYKKRKAKR
jgi:UDP-N-acetylmuramate--alanine ligase